MDNNGTKPSDKEINVEEIMYEIRERVRKQKSNIHSTESVNNTIKEPSQNYDIPIIQTLPCSSNNLNSMVDIQNNTYTIASHRKFLGKILVKGRQIVNEEVRRYVDPIIWKQSTFNEQVAELSSLYDTRITELRESLEQQQNENLQRYHNLQHQLIKIEEWENQIITDIEHIQSEQSNNNESVTKLNDKFEQNNIKLFTKIRTSLKEEIDSIISDSHPGNDDRLSLYGIRKSDQIDYFAFEEHFRGSRTVIKKRQSRYITFFNHCNNVLDIGCGRGEFLELLKEHEIPGMGIDINKEMVNYCNSKDLNAVQEDAIIYLRLLNDNHLDGIFSDQVIEHFTPEYLIRLLNQSYRTLKPEAYIVLGTVNILNPSGLVNFFVDPTHISPIHPEYLKFFLHTVGFRDIDILFRTYDEREIDNSNRNLELIAVDYAIVGKK